MLSLKDMVGPCVLLSFHSIEEIAMFSFSFQLSVSSLVSGVNFEERC